MIIPPFSTRCVSRTYAANFSFFFWAGVIPPIPMSGCLLLYVHSHCVAWCCASLACWSFGSDQWALSVVVYSSSSTRGLSRRPPLPPAPSALVRGMWHDFFLVFHGVFLMSFRSSSRLPLLLNAYQHGCFMCVGTHIPLGVTLYIGDTLRVIRGKESINWFYYWKEENLLSVLPCVFSIISRTAFVLCQRFPRKHSPLRGLKGFVGPFSQFFGSHGYCDSFVM